MVVPGPEGTLRVQQGVPCAADVDLTTPIIGGRLEITPVEGVDVAGGKRFALTRLNLSFAPFSVTRDCLGFGETRNYTEESVELGRTVAFTATPGDTDQFTFSIPKELFQFYQVAIVNGTLEAGYKRPSEDVTGAINYRLGTVKMHAVVATRVHFEAGCSIFGCIINEDKDGALTVDLLGTIVFPDADGDKIPDRIDNCLFGPNNDQTPVPTPIIRPPFNLTHVSCANPRIGQGVGTDVCDAKPVIVTNDAPKLFAVGPNIVNWQVTDEKQRVATAKQVVTVVDTTNPIFASVPPNVELNTCGPAQLGVPTATDDCAGQVGFTHKAPKRFPVGTTAVTWTATDASGNQATAAQLVTVVDTVTPAVACVPLWRPDDIFLVFSADACGAAPIRLGSFVLANGELIKVTRSRQPGVRLVGGEDDQRRLRIRHFLVGPGDNVIKATDSSANVGTAICR